MEAIPIKNCSSTLPALSTGIVPSSRVCRSLFGSVDHEETKSTLDRELNSDLSQKTVEWSFDFSEGTPILGGRLVWEEIRKLREDDELSSKSVVSTVSDQRRVPALHGESDCADDIFEATKDIPRPTQRNSPIPISLKTSPAVSPKSPTNEMKIPTAPDRKRKRQQCKTITDFMKQKKRRRVSHSSVMEKNSKTTRTVESHCAKDDLALRNSSKKCQETLSFDDSQKFLKSNNGLCVGLATNLERLISSPLVCGLYQVFSVLETPHNEWEYGPARIESSCLRVKYSATRPQRISVNQDPIRASSSVTVKVRHIAVFVKEPLYPESFVGTLQ
eukprot:Seg1026.5 transcript_id=Seg1026.5/GoldUCD/mRNA.D3Y31 product="Cyclin-dependent kinase inhibitor 1C" protein_id=Seg1026.5/GoldUCD/D3Y31